MARRDDGLFVVIIVALARAIKVVHGVEGESNDPPPPPDRSNEQRRASCDERRVGGPSTFILVDFLFACKFRTRSFARRVIATCVEVARRYLVRFLKLNLYLFEM